MKCQNCGKNEANVSYTEIINGNKKALNLCEECANKLRITAKMNQSMKNIGSFGIGDMGLNSLFDREMNIPNFLGGFFDDYNMDSFLPSIGKIRDEGCKSCNTTYNDFTNTGLFGCKDCYDVFTDRLDPILKNLQGANRHVGRKAIFDKSIVDRLNAKKEELEAEKSEKFEKTNKLKKHGLNSSNDEQNNNNKENDYKYKNNKDNKQDGSNEKKIEELRKELELSIKEERYEDSAKIRDQIRKLENK